MPAKDMLGTAVRKLVTLPVATLGVVCDLLEKLSDPDWVEATKRFLRKENPWPAEQETRTESKPKLLEFITTVALPAIPRFDAGAHFRVTPDNERATAEVLIGWLGDNAKRLVSALVEEGVGEANLRIHKLTNPSTDNPILAELGGEEVAVVTWGQIYEMIRRQGRGQQGNLRVDGYANIFYVKDASGNFWAVYCYWDSRYGGWNVGADPSTNPYGWFEGFLVLSR